MRRARLVAAVVAALAALASGASGGGPAEGDAHARLDAEPRPRRLLLRPRHRPVRQGGPRRLDPGAVRSDRAAQARRRRRERPRRLATSKSSSSPPRRSCPSSPSPQSCRSRSTRSWRSSRRSARIRDLEGRTIGITGVPSDYATLDTALQSAGLTRKDVKVVSVGYSLLPALLAHKRRRRARRLPQRRRDPARSCAASTRRSSPSTGPASPPTTSSSSSPTRHGCSTDPAYRPGVKRFVDAFLAGTDAGAAQPATGAHDPARRDRIHPRVPRARDAGDARPSRRRGRGRLPAHRAMAALRQLDARASAAEDARSPADVRRRARASCRRAR